MAVKNTAQPKTPTTATRVSTTTPAKLTAPAKAARVAQAAMSTKAAPAKPASRRAPSSVPAPRTAAAPPAVVPQVAAAPERPRVTVTHEDVRVRAYYLALEHGGKGGNLDFWLLAERELRTRATTGD